MVSFLLLTSIFLSAESIYNEQDMIKWCDVDDGSHDTSTLLKNATLAKPYVIPNFLPIEDCEYIIDEAEKHAFVNDGWETKRHQNYPTTDLDTEYIPSLKYLIQSIAYKDVIPLINSLYGIPAHMLGINEVFIAKYEFKPDRQRHLEQHRDGSAFTFVIALNNQSEYEGGGTRITTVNDNGETVINQTLKLNIGDVLLFPGGLYHEGVEITGGIRYIMPGFLGIVNRDFCERGVHSQLTDYHLELKFPNIVDDLMDIIESEFVENDRLMYKEGCIDYCYAFDCIHVGYYPVGHDLHWGFLINDTMNEVKKESMQLDIELVFAGDENEDEDEDENEDDEDANCQT